MTDTEFIIEAWKGFFELRRVVRRAEWENMKRNCAVFVELFRMHGNKGLYGHGSLRAALRTGKRYARLARKYA